LMMSSKTTEPRPGGAFWKDHQWRILLFSHKDVGLVFCYYEIIQPLQAWTKATTTGPQTVSRTLAMA
jgi:hypothetical protein